MGNGLSHLNSKQIEEVMSRYYTGGRIRDILNDYQINIHPSSLVSLFPSIVHKDLFCPYCESVNLETKYKRRSRRAMSPPIPFCPGCSHKAIESCNCNYCKLSKRAIIESINKRKQDVIYQNFFNDCICNPVERTSLLDAVCLLSITVHSASEDLCFIDPFRNGNPKLAPTFNLQNFIVKHLYAKSFIRISPKSNTDAFIFDEITSDLTSYYPTKVLWELLPNMDIHEKSIYLSSLRRMIIDSEWPIEWAGEIGYIWKQITREECIEYYLHLISQRSFDLPDIGEKTISTFEHLLDYLSPAQVLNLIWQAVRDTTDYIVKENLPKYKAKNMFIGAIQRKADKYRAERWEVRNSRRDFDCPQTVFSSTFFNSFMGVGEKGFNERYVVKEEVA